MAVMVAVAGTPAHAARQPRVALPNSVSPAVSHSARSGELDPGQHLSFAVTMRLRHTADLDRFLRAVRTPGSGHYRDFLTPEQFRASYGPTRSAVHTVTRYLRSQGLEVTHVSRNRQVVDVTSTAGSVEKALRTDLARYTSGSGPAFFAASRAPSLPEDVASLVSGVVGLDNHHPRHDFARVSHDEAAAPDGLGPDELRTAYHLNPLGDGSGATIAYWEFDGYDAANLTAYDKAYGLPETPPTTVSVDGASYDDDPGAGQVETELDLEIGHAVAPGAKQLVYEAPNTDAGQVDMAAKIASDAKADVVSISWGYCEPDSTRSSIDSTAQAIKQGVAEGISYVAASGDDGSTDCARSATGTARDAVDYPASDPNVTGVGGTTLTTADDGSYRSEVAWSGSGGGVSEVFEAPDWQQGGSHRAVPDVAAAADPANGYAIHTSGGWRTAGGTSAASPLWAGILALHVAQHERLGNLNPLLYRMGSGGQQVGLHDVTTGDNGGFSAGAGYDKVTGWGSVDGAAFSRALASG